MFFSKFITPAVVFLSAAATVFASPISAPAAGELITKRSGEVLDKCHHVYDSCKPLMAALTVDVGVTVDAVATVDAIVNVFVAATADLQAYVGVNVDADVDAIVAVNANILIDLVVALSKCGCATPALLAQIDTAIQAYLAVLAKINVGICARIGTLIAPVYVNLFVSLKLVLCARILALVNIVCH